MLDGFAWVPAGVLDGEGAVVEKVVDSLAEATVLEAGGRQFLLTHAAAALEEDLIRGLEGIIARLRAISALGSLERVSLSCGFRVEDLVAVRVALRDEADRATAERWSARRLPRESALQLDVEPPAGARAARPLPCLPGAGRWPLRSANSTRARAGGSGSRPAGSGAAASSSAAASSTSARGPRTRGIFASGST